MFRFPKLAAGYATWEGATERISEFKLARIRVNRVLHALRTGLWVIPLSLTLAGVALAFGMLELDKASDYDLVPRALTGPATLAQTILSTFIGSLVTLISIVMTVITVAVQLAMQQFSPRIVGPLLRNRRNQLAIGLFGATLAFSLVVLPQTYSHAGSDGSGLPGLSILTAEGLMLASVVALILYVHHAGQSMRVGGLIDLVGDSARDQVASDFPTLRDGKTNSDDEATLRSRDSGYVAYIDREGLVRAATEADCVLELLPAMGDFVPTGVPFLRVEGGRDGLNIGKVVRLVGLERERSHDEDPAYGIRKLVDIAERGLAEPFNDPSTAVQAFDRIHDILRMIAVREIPSGEHRDARGELRLITRSLHWNGYVLLGFEELRIAGAGSPQVSRRLRAALDDLKSLAPEERQAPLDRQIALLDAAIEAQFDEGEVVESARTPDPQGIGSATDIRPEAADRMAVR